MEPDAANKAQTMSGRLSAAVRTARKMSPEKRVDVLVRAGLIAKKDAPKAVEKLRKRRR